MKNNLIKQMPKLHQLFLLIVVSCAIATVTAVVVLYFLSGEKPAIENYPAYAQTAHQGSFSQIDTDKYLLTLENVSPQAIYLVTHPRTIFGQVPLLEMLGQTDFDRKPRAILELAPVDDRLIFFVMGLNNYNYDANRSSISYEVRVEKKYCEDKNSLLVACADEQIPASFSTATLFIENLESKKEYCRHLGQENCMTPLTPPTCLLPETFTDNQPTCSNPDNYTAVDFGDTWFCCLK